MSSPSELEYHLISRRPFNGLLSKRLPISGYVPMCPTVRGLLRKVFSLIIGPWLKTYCAVYRVIAARGLYCFPGCRVALFQPYLSGTFWRLFNLKPSKFYQKAVLEGRGFRPNFSVNKRRQILKGSQLVLELPAIAVFPAVCLRSSEIWSA